MTLFNSGPGGTPPPPNYYEAPNYETSNLWNCGFLTQAHPSGKAQKPCGTFPGFFTKYLIISLSSRNRVFFPNPALGPQIDLFGGPPAGFGKYKKFSKNSSSGPVGKISSKRKNFSALVIRNVKIIIWVSEPNQQKSLNRFNSLKPLKSMESSK